MAYFPLMIDLSGKRALIVGGGRIAYAKVARLVGTGLTVTVVAPEVAPEIVATRGVEIIRREFYALDVTDDLVFVVAATGDPDVNRRVAEVCRDRGVEVNVVDSPEESSFIFPAIFRKGALTAAFSTGGASPSAAISFRDLFAGLVPDSIEEILNSLADARELVKSKVVDVGRRGKIYRRLFEESIRRGRALDVDEIHELAEEGAEEKTPSRRGAGRVALVGAGSGDASLITIRGMQLLSSADVVLYDELIDKKLLDFAPSVAEKIPVGKRCGEKSSRQEQISAALVEFANRGLNVVRLKGGDPYLFGRGAEEASTLAHAGVPYEVVPGISSALYIPMEAGIPVTLRNVSRSVHIVAAHTSEDKTLENIRALATMEGTIVFLMGLGALEMIANELVAAGRAPETPIAVVSGGNVQERSEVRGTLADIAKKTRARGVKAPAVIVVGDVAALDLRDHSAEMKDDGSAPCSDCRKGRLI